MSVNADKLMNKHWNKKILVLLRTFESGPLLNFKREFRQLWTKYYSYNGSAMKHVHLVMTTLSNPSLNDLLVKKKPPRSLLTKIEKLSNPIQENDDDEKQNDEQEEEEEGEEKQYQQKV